MSNHSEKEVEAYFVSEVASRGGWTHKLGYPGQVGTPDRTAYITGVHFYVELTTNKGTLSPAQQEFLRRLAVGGVYAFAAYGKEGVDKVISFIDTVASPKVYHFK